MSQQQYPSNYDYPENYDYEQDYNDPNEKPTSMTSISSNNSQLRYKDQVKVQKDQDKAFYHQQYQNAQAREEQKAKEEAEKKRRLKQEVLESHQRQMFEKQQKKVQEKQIDFHLSRSTADNSSFANQDRQREEFMYKLKTGTVAGPTLTSQRRGSQETPTEIYNQKLSERQPGYQERSEEEEREDIKKQKQREMFLENQRIVNQKKSIQDAQKQGQKEYDYQKSQYEISNFEKEQELLKYIQAKQKEENALALTNQIRSKEQEKSYKVGDIKYDYQQPQRSDMDIEQQDAPKGTYLKNKQRNGGAGFNILTGHAN
jgi:hypothetical protein